MTLLNDINSARTPIEERAGTLANTITSDNRYNYDNAGQQDSWNGRWLTADRERLRQLNLLQGAAGSSDWTKDLDKEAETRTKAGNLYADAGLANAEDKRKVAGANGGAGGSWDKIVKTSNDYDMAKAKVQVAQNVAELKAAGVQHLDEMGRQMLNAIIAGPEETAAMGISAAGTSADLQGKNLADRNADQYAGLLSSSIGNFLNNSVTPAVQLGFQSADNWNQQQRENYTDARNSGTYAGNFRDWADRNGGTRTWW